MVQRGRGELAMYSRHARLSIAAPSARPMNRCDWQRPRINYANTVAPMISPRQPPTRPSQLLQHANRASRERNEPSQQEVTLHKNDGRLRWIRGFSVGLHHEQDNDARSKLTMRRTPDPDVSSHTVRAACMSPGYVVVVDRVRYRLHVGEMLQLHQGRQQTRQAHAVLPAISTHGRTARKVLRWV